MPIYKRDFETTLRNYKKTIGLLPTEKEANVLALFAYLGQATPPTIAQQLNIDGAEAVRLCKSLLTKGHLILTETKHLEFAMADPREGGLAGLSEGLKKFQADMQTYFEEGVRVPRASFHDQYGSIEATEPFTRSYFRRAKHEICISTSTGLWLWKFLDDLSGAARNGVRLRVLLMNPKLVSKKFPRSSRDAIDTVQNQIEGLAIRLQQLSPESVRYYSQQQIGSIVDGRVAILPIFHIIAQSAIRGTSVISVDTNLACHCQAAFDYYWNTANKKLGKQ